jgi:hypothetical protein
MTIDRVLIMIMALAIVAIILLIVGQAFGQFDSVLKTVLRPPNDDADPAPIELRLIPLFFVGGAIAALALLMALFHGDAF